VTVHRCAQSMRWCNHRPPNAKFNVAQGPLSVFCGLRAQRIPLEWSLHLIGKKGHRPMFGVGFFEMVIIAVVALVVVGPKRLPEVMRQAGRLFVHVRRTANDVRSTFDQVIREAEDEIRREEAQSLREALQPILDAKKDVSSIMTDAHTTTTEALAPTGTQTLAQGRSLDQVVTPAPDAVVAAAADVHLVTSTSPSRESSDLEPPHPPKLQDSPPDDKV